MTDSVAVREKTAENVKKAAALRALYDEYARTVAERPEAENAGGFSFVFGDGDVGSDVVLIGEAPGKDEVAEGRPFVGKAGSILSEFLSGAGIERGRLFITNAVKYRLAREARGGRGGLANRPAKTAEIRQGAAFLYRELKILAPDVIVTLGNVPLKALAIASACDALAEGVGCCHGKEFRHFDAQGGLGGVLMPLYHPASVIYNRALRDAYLEDLAALRRLIGREKTAEAAPRP